MKNDETEYLLARLPDAIILCGGAGLRLRSVTGNSPKSMATIGGRPFLELLLKQLERNGFRRVILAVGHQKEMIRASFGSRAFGLEVVYSEESSPLGTGGALRNAADLVETDATLAMNGDSYAQVDLRQFVAGHRRRHAAASMVVVRADGRSDCGSVLVDGDRVAQFEEKQTHVCAEYVNAGIYLLSRSRLYDIPRGRPVSLEKEIFPKWVTAGLVINAFIGASPCTDIGTPERYREAQSVLACVDGEISSARADAEE